MSSAQTRILMSDEDMRTFISYAQLGLALGLEHRYEWMCNAQRCLMHGVYTEIPEQSLKIDNAFLMFEKGLACCPEDEEDAENLTLEGLYDRVNVWYGRPTTTVSNSS